MDAIHEELTKTGSSTLENTLPVVLRSLEHLYSNMLVVALKQRRFDLVNTVVDILDLRSMPISLPALVNVLQVRERC